MPGALIDCRFGLMQLDSWAPQCLPHFDIAAICSINTHAPGGGIAGKSRDGRGAAIDMRDVTRRHQFAPIWPIGR